jgi:hypothetical protein
LSGHIDITVTLLAVFESSYEFYSWDGKQMDEKTLMSYNFEAGYPVDKNQVNPKITFAEGEKDDYATGCVYNSNNVKTMCKSGKANCVPAPRREICTKCTGNCGTRTSAHCEIQDFDLVCMPVGGFASQKPCGYTNVFRRPINQCVDGTSCYGGTYHDTRGWPNGHFGQTCQPPLPNGADLDPSMCISSKGPNKGRECNTATDCVSISCKNGRCNYNAATKRAQCDRVGEISSFGGQVSDNADVIATDWGPGGPNWSQHKNHYCSANWARQGPESGKALMLSLTACKAECLARSARGILCQGITVGSWRGASNWCVLCSTNVEYEPLSSTLSPASGWTTYIPEVVKRL